MENSLEIVRQNNKELFENIGKSREMVSKTGTLSKKHKYLIAMAIDAVFRTESGVRSLAEMAMKKNLS